MSSDQHQSPAPSSVTYFNPSSPLATNKDITSSPQKTGTEDDSQNPFDFEKDATGPYDTVGGEYPKYAGLSWRGGGEAEKDAMSANGIPTREGNGWVDSDSAGSDVWEGEPTKDDIPLKYKIGAFCLILFFATGKDFIKGVGSPLKSTYKKQLDITNAQYGTISSASGLVNTIIPILGGICMDYWGSTYTAVIAGLFVFVGNIVAAACSNTDEYGLLVGGLIIMGFGSSVVESVQSKLYTHWFSGSSLALMFALDIAWNRIVFVVSKVTAVPMTQINGFWGWALWIPAIISGVNWAIILAYWFYEGKVVPKVYRPGVIKGKKGKRIGWATIFGRTGTLRRLPKFFWIFCGSQLFQNAAVDVYSTNLADIQTVTRGTSKLAAGYNSAISQVIPIVLTPLTGLFYDRFGYRMAFVSFTAILYIIVFALIGLTQVTPLCPIIISSFALTTNVITFLSAIPILVGDDRLLGTAFGVWKAFSNCNSIVLDVAAGAIQDDSSTGSYDGMIYFIIAIKAVEVVLGPIYFYLDRIWLGSSLRVPEKKRVQIRIDAVRAAVERGQGEEGVGAKGSGYEGWKISKTTTWVVGAELVGLIIVAWVMFFVYTIG
ncbi:hypothetical protein B9479_005539 [Cryptococcus floricola]|uniref:Lysosomal dipeptide transporter MFSD1 n=1 Tax=Cryptococcus floricola TaxID=2591691 RepID=A0A5D3AUG7_9TREE|nr:hypothetical protein B9479_005539 [Cryptococcus floricola]